MNAVSESGARAMYEETLQLLVRELRAERALILKDEGQGELAVKSAHGLEPEQVFRGALISTTLLERVRREGAPLLTSDARKEPGLQSVFSLQVSEIRSVICVPFWNPQGEVAGLLYADCQLQESAFSREHLAFATELARKVEQVLFGTSTAPAQPRVEAQPRSPAPPSPPPRTPRKVAVDPSLRVPAAALSPLLRSLATLLGAGIHIHRGLDLLSQQEQDEQARRLCSQLSDLVFSGMSLSQALGQFPRALPEFYRQLIRVGERSGTLHTVLERIADYEERTHQTRMRVKSALTYPLFLLAVCTLMLIVVPPYLLEGQFQIIRNSGLEAPLLTRVVMAVSQVFRSPVFFLGAGLGAALVALGVRGLLRIPSARLRLQQRLLTVPKLGRTLKMLATTRFARALALQLKAGVMLSEALELSGQASDDPLLIERMQRAVAALMDGAPLSASLAEAEYFPAAFLHMLTAGEESGRAPDVLEWLAGLYETELEASLESFAAVLEPVIMLVMGVVVAVILVATLLPTLQVLQSL